MTASVQQPELDEAKSVGSGQPSSTGTLVAPLKHRHDLDGLRAFAIALVVAYHVWVGRVSGGVDVFLLLSAYFMTASLVRKAENGKFGLGTYWINRFWRLVPVAALTVGGVLLLTYFALPAHMWESVWGQSWSSLFYWQNWELASNAVDYYARGVDDVSPLLHFWSLSVQGQVFILWPLLLLGSWYVARLFKVKVRTIATGVFLAIFVASLVYSIWITDTNQTFAYYDTGARLWEFAIGSLVALVPLKKSLPRWAAEVVGWGGVVALLVCGMVLDVSSGFPGYLALWPALAAVAVIIAGETERTSFGGFLGSAPMRWLGKIAYPLYLVHWPILVAVMVIADVERPGLKLGGYIVAGSVALAIVIHYAVDKPLQRFRFRTKTAWAGVLVLAVTVAMVAVPLAQWQKIEHQKAAELAESTEYPGAEIVDVILGAAPDVTEFVPLPSQLSEEWATLDGDCAGADVPAGLEAAKNCSQTIVADGAPTMLIVGDSHAQQWMAAVAPLAATNEYNLTAVLRGGCAFSLGEYDGGEETGCAQWRTEVVEYIQQTEPDILVTLGTRSFAEDSNDRQLDGLVDTLDQVKDAVGQIVLIRDTPRYEGDMYVCIQENLGDISMCSADVNNLLAADNPIEGLSDHDIHIVDMSPYFCPRGECVGVIGNVVVYIDDNHVSKTFMVSLSGALARQLEQAGLQW